MKTTFALISVCALLLVSCKKENTQPNTSAQRTIKFILYTNEDFSNINNTINFTLHIKNTSGSIAFDSTLAGRRIKDIPGPSNKLIFIKTVPDDGSILTAGFLYEIKNVGYSWSLDTVGAHEKFKVIEYPFQ